MQNHMNTVNHIDHETELVELIRDSVNPEAVALYMFGLISDYLKTHTHDVKPVAKSNDKETRLLEIIREAPNPELATVMACAVLSHFAREDVGSYNTAEVSM